MKTSAILRRAKRALPRHTRSGICGTLAGLSFSRIIGGDDLTRVRHLIEDRIEPFAYAHDWLAWTIAVKKPVPKRFTSISNKQWAEVQNWIYAQTIDSIQQWRVEWLERMAVEFEAKGD